MRTLASLILLVALASITTGASAQNLEGFDDGGTVVRPSPHTGMQLLRSFYFRYRSDDHHLQAIGVTPDRPAFQQAQCIFQDHNGDDDYYFHAVQQDVFPFGSAAYFYGRDICRGSCTRAIPRPSGDYVFVLRGFYMYFQGDDHHLDQIKLMENNGMLTVAFNDKNDDDNFIWEVQYAYVPRSRFAALGERSGMARSAVGTAIPGGVGVIRGFDLNFRSDDHHIRELGVFMSGTGSLDVYFGDKNGDDLFDWRVRWGVLGSGALSTAAVKFDDLTLGSGTLSTAAVKFDDLTLQ